MKLFFDMEFTGLHKNTTPISLGVASEDGRKFYAIFSDFDKTQCDEWIMNNVIKGSVEDALCIPFGVIDDIGDDGEYKSFWFVKGNTEFISKELNRWINWICENNEIQFVSDVCHYDFVLLIDLLTNEGTALDLPKNISAVCHDLNQDIASYFHISDVEAFDMSREQIMNVACGFEDIVTGDKHNSLYDAEVIRAIYKEIVK